MFEMKKSASRNEADFCFYSRDVPWRVSSFYLLQFQTIDPFADFLFRWVAVQHAAFDEFSLWCARLKAFGGLAEAAAA